MKLYAGVDLHSNNNYLGIMDKEEKKVSEETADYFCDLKRNYTGQRND